MRKLLLIAALMPCAAFAQGLVIDHTCTDLSAIPTSWITTVQNDIQSHYAHTSHGGQLTYGIGFVEDSNSFYDVHIGSSYLPSTAGAYCVFDGQEGVTYITPDLYWESASGLDLTRAVLDNNPALDTSMWCWCCQCDYYNEGQVQDYLDAMSMLEAEYPGVTFIYFTGNAQGTGSSGYNRYLRNNQIRDYCAANDKVLFDFADLDCWWYNPSSSSWEHHTYSYNSMDIPAEHPQFYGDEYGHTTAESCTLKGRAWWWMMAMLAGWGGTGISSQESGGASQVDVHFRNPVTMPAQLSVELQTPGALSLSLYDASGRQVRNLCDGYFGTGTHQMVVDGLPGGVYMLLLEHGDELLTERLAVLN